MEIKIVQTNGLNKDDGTKTFLFEGSDIQHQHIYYANRAEFKKKYFELCEGRQGNIVGIQENFWKDDASEIASGYFLFLIYFRNSEFYEYTIAKQCTVFITNNGQTVDKIIVE